MNQIGSSSVVVLIVVLRVLQSTGQIAMRNMKTFFAQALSILGILFSPFAAAIEKPEYDVVLADGDVEYRRYKSFIVAETEILNVEDWKDATNEGFRRLFDYISGDNSGAEKIAMTAPVQQIKIEREVVRLNRAEPLSEGKGWRIGFMLPASYSMTDAPIPEDERISIRLVPERLVAVIRYSGRWTTNNFQKYETRLLDALSAANIETMGVPESAFYNPPFVPPFMRRNEVLVEVTRTPS